MTRKLPPLNALRAFEAAARLGRMSAAAEELSVTPGAISRQVRQLEDMLGTPLFEGSKNKPALTETARQLLPVLTATFDQIDAAVRTLKDKDRDVLDVGCFSTFTLKWLIPRLYLFKEAHPGLDIRLSVIHEQLDSRTYDVTITATSAQGESTAQIAQKATSAPYAVKNVEAVSWALFPEILGPVLAPNLAATMPLADKPSSWLSAHLLLRTKTRSNAWDMWATACSLSLPNPTGPTFEHYYFTLEAAVGGLGICVAPWHLVMDDLKAGRLVAPLGFTKSGYEYVALQRDGRNKNTRHFCQWLVEQANAMQ